MPPASVEPPPNSTGLPPEGKRPCHAGDAMNSHQPESAGKLFVSATELLETAHEVAVRGQSPSLTAPKALALARRLRKAANELTCLAGRIADAADGLGRRDP